MKLDKLTEEEFRFVQYLFQREAGWFSFTFQEEPTGKILQSNLDWYFAGYYDRPIKLKIILSLEKKGILNRNDSTEGTTCVDQKWSILWEINSAVETYLLTLERL